ncbi:MAG: pentapeptide repeat-containing protein [Alphaproteobacteria bacterium]|nr:pentapeptide repeat-containing protein [Alphaproteobacteria bacterium]
MVNWMRELVRGWGVKQWLERIVGGLRKAGQQMRMEFMYRMMRIQSVIAKGWKILVNKTARTWNRIVKHRVWIWAFAAIGIYLLISQYLFDLIDTHYLSHPPEPGHFRIDNLSFWDRDTEGARNLIFALGGWLGVLAAIVGFILAGFRTSTQLQMTQTAIDGQVTERFTKAVEQLGHAQRAVRLGASDALERIAIDSPRDRDTIVETLAAYIRELAPWMPSDDENGNPLDEASFDDDVPLGEIFSVNTAPRTPIDIAAALTIICRLLPHGDPMRQKVDLRHTDLSGLDAPGIDLSRTRINYTNLLLAMLAKANLSGAGLNGASLHSANLSEANLSEANLSEADLNEANLRDTVLSSTILSGASLCGAALFRSVMDGTVMDGADLGNVQNLTQQQLDGIRYPHDFPPINIPIRLTLPEPYDFNDDP